MFSPLEHRDAHGHWTSGGGAAGEKVIKAGSAARGEFDAHPAKNEIGAHLQAAQRAIAAGQNDEARHHLTNALAAATGGNAGALKATISSKRSKLPKGDSGHAEKLAAQILPQEPHKAQAAKTKAPRAAELNKAVGVWRMSSSYISQAMTGIITGNQPAGLPRGTDWGSYAQTLIDAIKTKSEDAPGGELHRGMKWITAAQTQTGDAKKLFDAFRQGPGAEFDIGAASWSKSKLIANRFADAGHDTGGFAVKVVLTATSARGLDIEKRGGISYEQEMISGGRYRVKSAVQQGSEWHVSVEQIGAIG
jgi:hypothetical protein